MMFKSIRSRLTMSFAGIALIAAIALGAVLLAILQNFYANQELDYLRGNAQFVGKVIAAMISSNASHDEMQSQIESLAFLSQTRVQVYDQGGHLLYDFGSPQKLNVNLATGKQLVMGNRESVTVDSLPIISIIKQGNSQSVSAPVPDNSNVQVMPDGSTPVQNLKGVFLYQSVQVSGSPFGFYLNTAVPMSSARSNWKIIELIRDPRDNHDFGSVVLSEGPAYGTTILKSVAMGWALASAIAILLAALIGWFISRRISAPVLALANVTWQMEQGDLSVRVDLHNEKQREFVSLANSFNGMAEQVEQTVSTLRAFVADAAHELHTPLTVLQANLELAHDEKKASERIRYLSHAQEQGQRLEALVKSST